MDINAKESIRRGIRAALTVAAGVGLIAATVAHGFAASAPPPWQRTETREPCSNFNVLRQPYFGDTHVHTTYSFDAVTGDVREDPRGAYSFAKGNQIGLPPYDAFDQPQRHAQLSRPLDFTAVTDHSEFFGEVHIALTPGSDGYDDPVCQDYRAAIPQFTQTLSPGIQAWPIRYTASTAPTRFDFCGVDYSNCLGQASLIWQDIQSAAEQYYDRTDACSFTSFVAYEWSGTPATPFPKNIHRNVIFRNEFVPALPITYVEEPTPQGLWAQLKTQCLDAGNGCDVLAIPHNSNLSGGLMFGNVEDAGGTPLISAAEAATRAAMEPLVELTQHKGDSECKPGVGQLTNDELCGFEKWNSEYIGFTTGTPQFAPSLFVRNALKIGLDLDQKIGANPFQFGVIGSTDTHNATPGNVRETQYDGHLGTRDATPENMTVGLGIGVIGGAESNPGGLAVVWAEENSRDALFAAMRRREAYSTSGTRPIVRFFGGRLSKVECGATDFVERGYQGGVPMGGEIGDAGGKPRFAVMAMKDPGEDALHPGTPLQRIQIVKGWVDGSGNTQEQVYDVATAIPGNPDDGSTVDTATCTPTSKGLDTLCTVWTDKDFDPAQRAFYYARVVEDPVCRWSTRLCNANGIDCSNPGAVPTAFANCCNPQYPKTIQERAVTSPIWYRPESIGKLRAKIQFGASPGTDVLTVKGKIRALPVSVDPNTQDLALTLQDDDTILNVTIPAGTMAPPTTTPGRFTYKDKTGSLGGVTSLSVNTKTGALSLKTVPMDLSDADRVGHMVEFKLAVGSYHASHSRLWGYATLTNGTTTLSTGS